jgi:hypothetical protein
MTDPADLGVLARTAYETGIDPVEYVTEQVIAAHFAARDALITIHSLPGMPACQLDLSPRAVACRVLADLLDAGMKLPEVTS